MSSQQGPRFNQLIDNIVNNLKYKRLLEISYSEEYFGLPNELVTYDMIKNNLYSPEVDYELDSRVGFLRVKHYISIPDKSVLYNSLPTPLGVLEGKLDSTMSSLLTIPHSVNFTNLENRYFDPVLKSFERRLLRVCFKSKSLLMSCPSEQETHNFGRSEAVNEDELLLNLKQVKQVMSTMNIPIDIDHQRYQNGNEATWNTKITTIMRDSMMVFS